jgi:hypothetical protein
MPVLTRRRSPDHRQECRQIYYGDIHAGTITERVGNPHNTERWEWRCGFYPGSNPGEHQSGQCVELDDKMEHYRQLAARVRDPLLTEGVDKLIEGMEAQKAAFHPEQQK